MIDILLTKKNILKNLFFRLVVTLILIVKYIFWIGVWIFFGISRIQMNDKKIMTIINSLGFSDSSSFVGTFAKGDYSRIAAGFRLFCAGIAFILISKSDILAVFCFQKWLFCSKFIVHSNNNIERKIIKLTKNKTIQYITLTISKTFLTPYLESLKLQI